MHDQAGYLLLVLSLSSTFCFPAAEILLLPFDAQLSTCCWFMVYFLPGVHIHQTLVYVMLAEERSKGKDVPTALLREQGCFCLPLHLGEER